MGRAKRPFSRWIDNERSTMKSKTTLSMLLVPVAIFVAVGPAVSRAAKRPNVVVILTDDK